MKIDHKILNIKKKIDLRAHFYACRYTTRFKCNKIGVFAIYKALLIPQPMLSSPSFNLSELKELLLNIIKFGRDHPL